MINNVVLICLDTLRFDCVGYQPDKRGLEKYDVLKYLGTPILDSIAEKSVCFTQCISTNTYTTAAHASLFTGLYPPRHNVRSFYGMELSSNVHTIAEILKIYGITTTFYTDTIHIFRPPNLTRGFDNVLYGNDDDFFGFLSSSKSKDSKNFIFIHLFDIHNPYLSSENPKYNDGYYLETMKNLYEKFRIPFESSMYSESEKYFVWNNLTQRIGRRKEILMPLYIQGVTKFDGGRFKDIINTIDRLGYMDDSAVFIFSDHGEGRADYNDPEIFGHSGPLFDDVIRIPLMIHCKDLGSNINDRLTSIVDIFPTVLSMMTDKKPDDILPYQIDGVSIFSNSEDRMVYSETWLDDSRDQHWNLEMSSYLLFQRALRSKTKKYIVLGRPERLDNRHVEKMSDEEFLIAYHRDLLCEFENYDVFFQRLNELKTNTITKEGLIDSVSVKSYYSYDLIGDPFEVNAVLYSKDAVESSQIFSELFNISGAEISLNGKNKENSGFFVEVSKRLLLVNNEHLISLISTNKHLINEMIEKAIFDPSLSDQTFIKRAHWIFLGNVPKDDEINEIIYMLNNGVTRRSYFNKKIFNNAQFARLLKMPLDKYDIYAKNLELQEYKDKYEAITGSLFYKVFLRATYLLDRIIFKEGTMRHRFYLSLLRKIGKAVK